MDQEITCKLHGTRLRSGVAHVSYGLPSPDPDLERARVELFPNSRSTVAGGCLFGAIGDDCEVMICDQCREAENRWRKENGRRDWIGFDDILASADG